MLVLIIPQVATPANIIKDFMKGDIIKTTPFEMVLIIRGKMNMAILVGIMSVMTIATRFLPFVLFRKKTPEYIAYLGDILPSAIIAMLVIYCLKDICLQSAPFGIPELISALAVVILQAWKHNALLSILSGTIFYMLLVQIVFR